MQHQVPVSLIIPFESPYLTCLIYLEKKKKLRRTGIVGGAETPEPVARAWEAPILSCHSTTKLTTRNSHRY